MITQPCVFGQQGTTHHTTAESLPSSLFLEPSPSPPAWRGVSKTIWIFLFLRKFQPIYGWGSGRVGFDFFLFFWRMRQLQCFTGGFKWSWIMAVRTHQTKDICPPPPRPSRQAQAHTSVTCFFPLATEHRNISPRPQQNQTMFPACKYPPLVLRFWCSGRREWVWLGEVEFPPILHGEKEHTGK